MTATENPAQADFLVIAARQLAAGVTLTQFSDWFADQHARNFPAEAGNADARRAAMAMAREIWRLTPDPAQGWRQRTLPRPGRNDPCICGSGRKFKQCCEPLAAGMPALPLEPHDMAAQLFAVGPPSWREPGALRRMPGLVLAAAALGWGQANGKAAVVDLLEPVFLTPSGLVDSHAEAFDVLLDALLEGGLGARRQAVAQVVAGKATSRALRCSAHARLATLASDRGDSAAAWAAFGAARREAPDDPQLLHLELVLLLAEERTEEARLRGPMLAARARKLGYDELAEALLQLARDGLDAMLPADPLGDDDEEHRAWGRLLREPAGRLKPQTFLDLHTIEVRHGELELKLSKPAARLLKPWSARFAATPPLLTRLDAESDALLDEPEAAREWLLKHPDAAAALPVLDDLLLAARSMVDESDSPDVAAAHRQLAFGAAAMVVEALQAWPDARISWLVHGNRPLLRLVSQGVSVALMAGDGERAETWMRWMLRRNPTDNHGWREVLRQRLLVAGDATGALALLDAYPDDMPPAGHDRSLAVYLLGRLDEAADLLRAAHAEHPAFVPALLPDTLDRPPGLDAATQALGGVEHAWDWRQRLRPVWERSGALAWVRELKLRQPAARKAKPKAPLAKMPPAKAPPAKTGRKVAVRPPASSGASLLLLRQAYGARLPWLLGWIASMAWAPALTMPTAWLGQVLGTLPDSADLDQVQALAMAVFEQYNAFNGQRLAGAREVPLPDAIDADDDAGWSLFAAGFVQAAEAHGRAAWRAAGAVSRSSPAFGPLYQLAARAAPGPDGWGASDDASAPLLAVVGDTEPAHRLLLHALQPLWKVSIGTAH